MFVSRVLAIAFLQLYFMEEISGLLLTFFFIFFIKDTVVTLNGFGKIITRGNWEMDFTIKYFDIY